MELYVRSSINITLSHFLRVKNCSAAVVKKLLRGLSRKLLRGFGTDHQTPQSDLHKRKHLLILAKQRHARVFGENWSQSVEVGGTRVALEMWRRAQFWERTRIRSPTVQWGT